MHVDLKNLKDGDKFEGTYLLESPEIKFTKNSLSPKPYLDGVLADKSAKVTMKLWDVTDPEETFENGIAVDVVGTMGSYLGKPQITLKALDVSADQTVVKDLVMAATRIGKDVSIAIKGYIAKIVDEDIKKIVIACLTPVWQEFFVAPAAKGVHHAYLGGLALHTLSLLELAEFVCNTRKFLNSDLVYAGILLHDFEKIREMDSKLGAVSDYTKQGKLLGHIVMAGESITLAAKELGLSQDDERVLLLKHCVYAHHGKGEWGSPITPKIPEAVLIHWLDQLDAKMQASEDALAGLRDDQEWTEPLLVLDRSPLYKSKLGK